MKSAYKLLSTILLCLPILCVSLLLDCLPARIPVHFTDDGQPDSFASRQVLFNLLIYAMFILLFIRMGVVVLLSRRFDIQASYFVRVYLLSAALTGSVPGLFVLWAVYPSPSFFDFLPVVVALFGAGGVYFTTSADLPTSDKTMNSALPPRQTAILQQLHSLSRLVMVRVNVLAALLMLFARSGDRWAIGIWANLLAFIALFILAGIYSRQSN